MPDINELGERTLAREPQQFFMTLRDIAFWIRSARADAALARLRRSQAAKDAFDQLYQSKHDPFAAGLPQFRYQRRKYEALVGMLPDRRYREVLDVGCGIGVLARQLAPHAERVLGIDLSQEAVQRARTLSESVPNLEFSQADVTCLDDDGRRFDLIVVADIIYYLAPITDAMLKMLASRIAARLAPNGLLLLVNHFFFAVDSPSRMTRRIHEAFRWSPDLARVVEQKRAFYLATILERRAIA
ncbi:MAG TPA: class I SAM-dependent methyltransferase [Thermoanaerobaculia bacterium]|nr:class I SAM-dependent methyltransferase [Thermoanaerobaculia bacterium]